MFWGELTNTTAIVSSLLLRRSKITTLEIFPRQLAPSTICMECLDAFPLLRLSTEPLCLGEDPSIRGVVAHGGCYRLCFCLCWNIEQVIPKISYFYYARKYLCDPSIPKIFYLNLITKSLAVILLDIHLLQLHIIADITQWLAVTKWQTEHFDPVAWMMNAMR